jgi:O-antigen/teichoic acid export membrane protein
VSRRAPADTPIESPSLSPGVDESVAPVEPYGGRIELGGQSLRQRTARGAIVNSAFHVAILGLGLVRNIALAALLTASEFGFLALVITVLLALTWLKQAGIGDKYIQQNDPDQEAAFQKAFTLELSYSAGLFGVAILAMPVYALIYDNSDVILPGIVLCAILLTSALQTPVWIAYRQMRFVRQRMLEAVDPIVSTTVAITLAVAGAGYWSLIIGLVAGSLAGAAVALASCPFRIRLRYERGTLREYMHFSWPLVAASLCALVAVQGTVIVGNYTIGLAGVGVIGLAGQVAKFVDQVDAVIGRTIYPAVCAVRDRVDLLEETFVKSNRLALMWGVPFGLGLALFAPDLITYVIGETWREGELLLQALGVIFALRQVAFNWTLFLLALGRTKPIALEGAFVVAAFALVTVPMLILVGLDGYAVGSAATVAGQLAVRAYFMRRIFEGFGFLRHLARALLPSVCAVVAVLALRVLLDGDRSLEVAITEVCVYVGIAAAATVAFERRLLRELLGYLRRTSLSSGGPPDPERVATT